MPRWEPDPQGRLERAALELFAEQGFDQTTVAAIAERAGLSRRSFFRYFADKREVLFWGQGAMRAIYAEAIAGAPAAASPMDAVAGALRAAAELHESRRELIARRQAVIAAHAELQERELLKRATLTAAMTDALHRRGVAEPAASLVAESGTVVFKVAFARWVAEGVPARRFAGQLIDQTLAELREGVTG